MTSKKLYVSCGVVCLTFVCYLFSRFLSEEIVTDQGTKSDADIHSENVYTKSIVIEPSRVEQRQEQRGKNESAGPSDFSSLQSRLSETHDSQRRKNIVSSALPALIQAKGVDACSQWILENLTGNIANYANYVILESLLQNGKPILAAKKYLEMPFCPERMQSASQVAEKMIEVDFALATNWYQQLPRPEQLPAFSAFRNRLVERSDIGGLIGLLQVDAVSSERNAVIRSIVGLQFKSANASGIEEFIRNSDPESGDIARETVIALGHYSAIQDIEKQMSSLRTDESRLRALSFVTGKLASENPLKTANESLRLADNYKLPAIRTVIRKWAHMDPNATAEWIGGIPDQNIRDAAIGAFIELIKAKDPESARDSAKAISDPKLRKQAEDGIHSR